MAGGCQLIGSDQPIDPIIIDPRPAILVERDSISVGEYLGVQINEKAESAYAAVQSLTKSPGVSYLNVISNISSDLSRLANRIPLYSYILLDQEEGTDSGIQITLEAGKVKHIYLNSGKKLNQWPEKANAKSSIRLGDKAEELYEKLVRIREISQYAEKFERISLQTKDLAVAFDPSMAQSPQWYFAYTTTNDLLEVVKVNLTNKRVSYIVVERFKR